jgi:thiol-disulfide isomerase/thioredoxin
MNIGPFALPIGPTIFFVSFAVAILAGWLVDKQNKHVEPAIFTSVAIGLIVARIAFVLQYLAGYEGSLLKMLDFRDAGFDTLPGVAAGIVVVLIFAARRKAIRRPLLIAAVAGLLTWSTVNVATDRLRPPAMAPTVMLADAHGGAQALPPRDGKPFVVNLWASWCGPCRDEMPVLANAQATYPGLDLIFVNQGESPATANAFLAGLNLRVANSLFDPSLSVAKATDTTAYPTTLFYDASGRLLERHLGRFSQATFEATINRLYPASVRRAEGAGAAR